MFDALARWVVFSVLQVGDSTYAGTALHFFVMDIAKIFVLLAVVIVLVTYVRTYFSPLRTRQLLAGRKHWGHLAAGCLGIVTPFCSCSAVPMFIGFIEGGVPLGVTMTFLIASPAINEIAIALLFGLFGFQITAMYIGSGLIIAIAGGLLIDRLKMERHVEDYVWQIRFDEVADAVIPSQRERIVQSIAHMRLILGRIWPYVVIGIAVGALIHGYVPEGWISEHLGTVRWWSVPLAVAIGVPLYGNAGSTLPIVQALIAKGVPIGTALALMMSITAISLPELILLRRVLKPRLLATFVGIVAAAITAVGFLFNAVL
jgi:uncharacterized protein